MDEKDIQEIINNLPSPDIYKNNIRNCLRKLLIESNNSKNNKEIILKALNKTESAIKGWTAPSSDSIPKADELAVICKALNVSINEMYGIEIANEDLIILSKIKSDSNLKTYILGMKDE